MDAIAEYAARYHGVPRDDQPWHEVLALVHRTGRFDIRDRLVCADGSMMGRPVAEKDVGQRQMLHAKLERLAYGGE